MIIKNNYLRILYNLAKWITFPLWVGVMVATIFPNPVKMIVVVTFLCILHTWHNSRDALSE